MTIPLPKKSHAECIAHQKRLRDAKCVVADFVGLLLNAQNEVGKASAAANDFALRVLQEAGVAAPEWNLDLDTLIIKRVQ